MESPIRSRDPQPKASDLSIHDAKERCFRCLDDYTAHENPKFAAHAQGLEQMLQLWAKHAGVDARKGMSLDDRLKDHPDLKTTFIGLLELIERRMTEALSSPHDDADTGDIPTTVITNDKDDDDSEELLIKQKWQCYRGNIWETISAAVDMLIKLTAMVRKASVSVRNSSLAAHLHSQDDYFAGYAKILARNWLKDARRSLTDQLGHSVSVRRRYILYNMRHEEKISARRTEIVPAPAKTTPVPPSMREVAPKIELSKKTPSPARFTRPVNPVFAGTTPSSTNLSQLDISKLRRRIRNPTAPSGITEGSVSIEETGFSYMFPEPPSLGSMRRYAPCPYCSAPLSEKDLTKDAWRKHLYEDLQPYVCISEKCQATMQLFPNSKRWLQHMEEFHGNDWPRTVHMKTWHCDTEHEREEFKSEGELRNHLVNNHTSLSDAHVSALVRRNWGIGCREAHICPLCESTPTNIALLTSEEDKACLLFRHIGNHLQALALFSLPSLTADPAGDGQHPSSAAQLTSDGLKADPQENKPAAAEFHDDSLGGSLNFDDVPQGHSNASDSEAIKDKEDSSFLPPDLGAEFVWELASSNEETHGPDSILDSFRAWHEKSQHITENKQTILNWLTPVDYGPRHCDFINRWVPGTCQWVLDSTAFQEWLGKDKHTLFCPGIPGAGKTIITAVVIDYLQSMFQDDQSTGIAYIYCNFRQQDKQKTEDLLASLLKQLSQGQPSLHESVRELYNGHKKDQTRPSINEISSAVDSVVAAYSRIFIIVDALDECHNDQCRTDFLSRVFDIQRKSGAKFFATSRNIPNITKEFKKRQSLEMEIRATDQDLREYIHQRMGLLARFAHFRPGLQEEAKIEIVKTAEGMFILAKIHVDYVIIRLSPKAFGQALKEFREASKSSPHVSSVLDAVYDDAMYRIGIQNSRRRQVAMHIFSWIVKAKRPITVTEVQHALAVEGWKTELDEKTLPEIEDIVSTCSGLVTVDKESVVIRLVHFTMQDYFERRQKDWFPQAETDITKVCTTYLSFRSFQSGFCRSDGEFEERLRSNPLYKYAAQNWGFHARAASNLGQEVWKFLTDEKSVESAGQALMAVKRYSRDSNYSQNVVRQTSGLHLAAYFGVEEVVKTLLQQDFKADGKDSHGRTPLSWAAEYGHDAVVQLLLDLGKADVESMDNSWRTPLLWAAKNGHDKVVRLLLDLGKADVESMDNNSRTPLSWAAEYGHDAVVQLLLDLGKANVESIDDNGRTPLSWAAGNGFDAVVRLLVD